jgi:acetoin utilization deacetylase AcuC-like enzyme
MRVGYVYDPVYLEHNTGTHVEDAQRLISINSSLEESDLKDILIPIPPRQATPDELSMVHVREYVSHIEQQANSGGGQPDPDTIISPGSYQAAIYAAGGVLSAVDAVLNKQVDSAFALVRPPGHHATCWHSMGFCLFNNIAIGTKYALSNYDIKRVLIVDFDVHHGNGTQDTFYADSDVLFFSTHEYPFYPGTGSIDEVGAREGQGYTVNVPLIAGWGDDEYQAVYEDILAPVARRFQPELIMVSAGYDAHWMDSIALMNVSVSGFARIIEIIKVLADTLCKGNLVLTLEGGYHQEALAASVAATFKTLMGNSDIEDPFGKKEQKSNQIDIYTFIDNIKDKHRLST